MQKIILKIKNFTIMNKKITTTVAFVLLCSPAFCQFLTPNGNPVNAALGYDTRSPKDIEANDIFYMDKYPNATLIKSSDGRYNCHSYA